MATKKKVKKKKVAKKKAVKKVDGRKRRAIDPKPYKGMSAEAISKARGISARRGRELWASWNRPKAMGPGDANQMPHRPTGGKPKKRTGMLLHKEEMVNRVEAMDAATDYPRGGVPQVMARGVMSKEEQKRRWSIISDDPDFPIVLEDVTKFASIGCTLDELAMFAGVTVRALERRLQTDKTFWAAYQEGYLDVRRALRRTQLRVALQGDTKMLIWLGKQLLNQKEVHHIESAGGIPLSLQKADDGDERMRQVLKDPDAREHVRALLAKVVEGTVIEGEKS